MPRSLASSPAIRTPVEKLVVGVGVSLAAELPLGECFYQMRVTQGAWEYLSYTDDSLVLIAPVRELLLVCLDSRPLL